MTTITFCILSTFYYYTDIIMKYNQFHIIFLIDSFPNILIYKMGMIMLPTLRGLV